MMIMMIKLSTSSAESSLQNLQSHSLWPLALTHQMDRPVIRRLIEGLARYNKWHLAYTGLLFFNNFAYGISVTIVNSTMLDMGHILGVSLNSMSYLAMAISGGYQLGALSSYLLAGSYFRRRHLNRQLVLASTVLLMALTTSLLPHYRRLALALPAMALAGVGSGSWDSSVHVWLVEMHSSTSGLSAAVLQANMFFSGLGSVVAPLMVAGSVHGNGNLTEGGEEVTVERRIADLQVPFALEGVLQALVPLGLLATYFVHRYSPPEVKTSDKAASSKSSLEKAERSSANQDTPFKTTRRRKTKLALLAASASLSMAAEMGHSIFSSALWQQLGVLTAPQAATALAVFTGAYTASRLLAAITSLKLSPGTILSLHYLLIIGSLVVLFLGRESRLLILVGNGLLGVAFAPMWPAMFAFTEQHLGLSDQVCASFAFLSGAVTLIMPNVLAQLFTDFPLVIFLVEGLFVIASLVLFVVVRVLMRRDERG